jgi:hypothetical protein
MNLHRKSIQNCRQNKITRKPKPAREEIPKYNNFVSFGSWDLLIKSGARVTNRKNLAASYSLIKSAVTFDSPNTKAGGYDFAFLASTKSFGSSSTSARSSSPPDLVQI